MAEPIRNDSHLAALLGVSRAMVSRHKAMGMPTSSLEVARDWRAKNLNTAQRKDYNHARNWHAKKPGTPAAINAALQRVQKLAPLAHEAAVAGRFDLIRSELEDAMRAVPRSHQSKIALSLETFDALLGHIVQAVAPSEGNRLAAKVAPASEMEAVGALLLDLALGQPCEAPA